MWLFTEVGIILHTCTVSSLTITLLMTLSCNEDQYLKMVYFVSVILRILGSLIIFYVTQCLSLTTFSFQHFLLGNLDFQHFFLWVIDE